MSAAILLVIAAAAPLTQGATLGAADSAAVPPVSNASSNDRQLDLEVHGCTDLSVFGVRDIAAVELRHLSAAQGGPGAGLAAAPRHPVTALVSCASGEATLTVKVARSSGKTTTRRVILHDVAPVAHAHLIGLAIVELISDSATELQTPARPVAATPKANSAPNAAVARLEMSRSTPRVSTRAAGSAPDRRRLVIAMSTLAFTDAPLLWGGSGRLQHRGRSRWGWELDVAFHHGVQGTPLGDVSVDVASSAVSVYGEWAAGIATWHLAVGVQAGGTRIRGSAAPPIVAAQMRGVWGGPEAQVGLVLAPAGRLRLAVAVESGWTLLPVTAAVQGHAPVALRGGWARLSMGAGFSF